MIIKDNYLDQKSFNQIEKFMTGYNFPWFFNNVIDSKDKYNELHFTHIFYINSLPTSENLQNLSPILELLQPFAIARLKANLFN